jgi:hypothetical protein
MLILNEKQSDLLIERLSSTSSTDLSFFNNFIVDNVENDVEQQNSQLSSIVEIPNESSHRFLSTDDCSSSNNSSIQQVNIV